MTSSGDTTRRGHRIEMELLTWVQKCTLHQTVRNVRTRGTMQVTHTRNQTKILHLRTDEYSRLASSKRKCTLHTGLLLLARHIQPPRLLSGSQELQPKRMHKPKDKKPDGNTQCTAVHNADTTVVQAMQHRLCATENPTAARYIPRCTRRFGTK